MTGYFFEFICNLLGKSAILKRCNFSVHIRVKSKLDSFYGANLHAIPLPRCRINGRKAVRYKQKIIPVFHPETNQQIRKFLSLFAG
jgi:hypothetical protein